MDDREILALHRALVAIPSVSKDEARICEELSGRLEHLGATVVRAGNSLLATRGARPALGLLTHVDTVPPSPSWTRPPHDPTVEDGRVYGLGSNDAKASVAAMVGAFARLPADLGARVCLMLACEEEVGGRGADALLAVLADRGIALDAAVVGEPTGLDVAVAQKGLVVLELSASGEACHAAHARALGARSAIREIARDIDALAGAGLGPEHPLLGPQTLEPTVIQGGSARNMVPSRASCVLDARVNPGTSGADLVSCLRPFVRGEIAVLSDRLRPREIDPRHPLVAAASRARHGARLIGTRGVSDWALLDMPAIKVGPGLTERSHTADEFVLESEILEGARFYEALVRELPPGARP